jgi:hypothetical protein
MYRNQIRAAALATGLLFTTLATGQTASAQDDPGPTPSVTTQKAGLECPLRRVDTHFVRCDDLTGAGATAGSHIPQRG